MTTLTGVIFSFFISLFLPAYSFASETCGTIEVSKGDVKVQSGKTKQISAGSVGSKICSGDTIIAANESRAKLKMPDGNELNISPNSKIVIENYQFNQAANKKKVLLNIMQGKVRATTKQENMYNDKDSDGQANTFQIRTKTAVAGVRGTDFLTSFDAKTLKSEVVTFKGKVEFGQPGPRGSIVNSVQVNAGFKTEVMPGQPPAPPAPVPTADLERTNSESKSETSPNQSGNSNPTQDDSKQSSNEEKKPDSEENKPVAEEKKPDGEEKKPVAEEKKPASEEKKPVAEEKKPVTEEKNPVAEEKKPVSEERKSVAEDKKADAASEQQGQRPGPRAEDRGRNSSSPGNSTAQNAVTGSNGAVNRSPAAVPPPSMTSSSDLAGGAVFAGPSLPSNSTVPTVFVPPPPPIVQPAVPVCEVCNQVIQNSPSRVKITIQLPSN